MDRIPVRNMYSSVPKINLRNQCISLVLLQQYITMHGALNVKQVQQRTLDPDATEVFIADLIACSTCFGHHYAHHQELESIIQLVAACGISCCGFSSSWSGVQLRVMCPVCRMLV